MSGSSSSSSSTGSNNVENIQLTVRCALQSFEDLTINCPVEWKVSQLKGHLLDVCPTKPDPKRQRLIYGGHCLKDTQTLREISEKASEGFEPGEVAGPQVIHLVCASKEPPQLSSGLRHRPNANTSNNNNNTNNVGATATGFNAAGQQNYYMQNAGSFTPMNTVNFPQYQIPANATPEQMAYYSSLMSYQQAVMTWMQYNQAAVGGVVPQQMFAASPFSPFVQAGPYNVQFNLQAGGHGINHPLQQQMVDQNAQNLGNNQAPQVAGNDEEHVNDILGILYKSIRVGFFLMVLFFYSSFERFLAVFLIICILWYFHRQREQNNLNAAARRVVQGPPQPAAPRIEAENNEHPEAANDDQPVQQQNDNNNNEVPAPQHQQQPNPQIPMQTPMQLFCSTVSSFFLSLIPENPVPMDVGGE